MLCGAVLGAAACASSQESVSSVADPVEPITLTMWSWGDSFDELIDDFERENPGITVDVQVSGFNEHHDGLQSALASGLDIPDVAAIERAYIPVFIDSSDDFTDLRDHGADDFADQYLPWRWNEGVDSAGSVVGLPTDVGGLAFAYRTDLFEQAGLPTDPARVADLFADWPTLFDTARQFNAAGLDAAFLDSPDSVYTTSVGQQPMAYYDDDGALVARTSTGIKLSFERTLTAVEEDLTAELRQFSPEWNESMASGGFAVVAAPSWMRSYIADVAPDTAGRWAVAPAPGRVGNWGGSQLVVPAETDHPEAAFALARYLTDPDAQLELFRENGQLPSAVDLHDREEILGLSDEFFGGQVVGQLYIDSVTGLPGQPVGEDQQQIHDVMLLTFFDIADGTLEPEVAWTTAIDELEGAASSPG